MKKKLFFLLMLVLSCYTILPFDVLAEKTTLEELTATKEAIKTENRGEYNINISVPGKEATQVSSYNVLFVIDASTSIRDSSSWGSTRTALLEMVDVLLPDNSSSNVNKIGLISFGIDWHLNIELTNDKSKFYAIPDNYAEASRQLLAPGRSATNTEAGLNGAKLYLESLSESEKKDKEHTYVIFLTDGKANYSEAKYNFYELSQNYKHGDYVRSFYTNIIYTLAYNSEITRESFYDESIEEIKSLYQKLNPESEETDFEKMLDALSNEEEYTAIINKGVIALHEFKGLDVTQSYSINEMERAIFTKASVGDEELESTYVENLFYYEMITPHPTSNAIEIDRTISIGKELSKYATIYTIGFGGSNDESKQILDPEYYTSKTGKEHYSSGYSYASTTNISDKFSNLTKEIIEIKYKNATIVDYTSKWVDPIDINNDGVFDEKDIYITNNGEKVETKWVTVTKLTQEEIDALNDEELSGNTSKDIYKITWEVTNYLRSWDKYMLTYKVKVDTKEPDFVSDTEYKANGKTTLTYDIISKSNLESDETSIEENIEYDISVPTVKDKILGKIIVHYIDDEGNRLADDIVTEDEPGQPYQTTKKDFENYELIFIEGDETGTYNEDVIHVTYIYMSEIKDVGTEIEPPHTSASINTNFFNIPLYIKRKED